MWVCIVWCGMEDVHPVIGECVWLVIFWADSDVIVARCWTVGVCVGDGGVSVLE